MVIHYCQVSIDRLTVEVATLQSRKVMVPCAGALVGKYCFANCTSTSHENSPRNVDHNTHMPSSDVWLKEG